MIERRKHSSFTLEPGQTIGIAGKRFGQGFDRDLAAKLRVTSFPYFAHAAPADLFKDLILAELCTGFDNQTNSL
jgi:hypothetical protein